MVSETLINEGIRSTEEKQLAWEKANPVYGCRTRLDEMVSQLFDGYDEEADMEVWGKINPDSYQYGGK